MIDCMEMNDTEDRAFVGLQQEKEELLARFVAIDSIAIFVVSDILSEFVAKAVPE